MLPIIQIYEVQDPATAERLIRMGVGHIGSVLLDETELKSPAIKAVIGSVRRKGALSSLIPLFSRPEAVFAAIDHYQPDMIHFCEDLSDLDQGAREGLIDLQRNVRRRFPRTRIMRSIPIQRPCAQPPVATLTLARHFAAHSDLFLTDTRLDSTGLAPAAERSPDHSNDQSNDQPVRGFVGITGLTCDWRIARRLVEESRIPVILAGGLGPGNVYAAIRAVKPYGVDSCTRTNIVGHDGAPIRFQKDFDKVAQLIAESRKAFASLKKNSREAHVRF